MIVGLVAAVPVLVLTVLPTSFVERVLSFGEYLGEGSVNVRLENQSVALDTFFDHPVLGICAGNFESQYKALGVAGTKSGLAVGRTKNLEVMNALLEIAAETGIVGLLVMFGFMAMLVRDVLYSERRDGQPRKTNIATYALITLVVSLFCSFFTSVHNWREWWLFMAIPVIIRNIGPVANASGPQENRPAIASEE